MIADITRFEIRKLFSSPLAWIVLAVSQLILAVFFYRLLAAYILQPAIYGDRGLTETIVAGFYQNSGVIFVLLVPFLSMRLISGEIRQGTHRLLFSSPVSIKELILGKYLALLLYLFALLLIVSLVPASLAVGTGLDYIHFAACLTGLVLLMAALTAIGLFVSTLFRYPVLAATVTFAVLVFLWTAHVAINTDIGVANLLLNYLSMYPHFVSFTQGVFSTTDFFYFVIVSITFVSLSIWRLDVIQNQHW